MEKHDGQRQKFLAKLILVLFLIFTGCIQVGISQWGSPVLLEAQAPDTALGKTAVSGSAVPQEGGVSSDKDAVPAPDLFPATVVDVVDGDTSYVVLDGNKKDQKEKVRFTGVDAPELTEPAGREAALYAESRLRGRRVWLEKGAGERDKYGRLLAYVWFSPPEHGAGEAEVRAKMFNAELLLTGHARVMIVPPNLKYAGLFDKLYRETH